MKYTYIAAMDETSEAPVFKGVVKVNLQAAPGADALAGRISYPPHCYGGEVQFVPSGGAPTASPRIYMNPNGCLRKGFPLLHPAWLQ